MFNPSAEGEPGEYDWTFTSRSENALLTVSHKRAPWESRSRFGEYEFHVSNKDYKDRRLVGSITSGGDLNNKISAILLSCGYKGEYPLCEISAAISAHIGKLAPSQGGHSR